jgi:hypothetical protein
MGTVSFFITRPALVTEEIPAPPKHFVLTALRGTLPRVAHKYITRWLTFS